MSKTSRKNPTIDKKTLARLKEAVVTIRTFVGDALKEILLFGSYARGEQRRFSSIDILVVVSRSDQKFIKRKVELEKLLNESETTPLIDALIYTEEEIQDLIQKKESFIVSVLNEGIVIWHDKNDLKIESQLSSDVKMRSRYAQSLPNLEDIYC